MKNVNLPLSNNIITCDNISIKVGPKKHKEMLIHNFNYVFKKGTVYAIIGNSGVGKTTLVNHLNGLKKTPYGDIFIKDKAIYGKQRKVKKYKDIRKDVGLVFQFPEYQLFKDTVEKDIMYAPINYHVNNEKARKLAAKYMYLVGLDKSLLRANPFDLSNGQKRLVAIAGILAIDSDVVVFDEPTAGLDPQGQKRINRIIKQLKKDNKTVIFITHDVNNVLELADQVLVIHNKQLYASGTPYEIFTNTNLLNTVGIETPKLIEAIDNLFNNKDKSIIIDQEPKNIDQLMKAIKKGGCRV